FCLLSRAPLSSTLFPYTTLFRSRYGVGRVPGDFGQAALFALGPLMATHYLPLTEVAYLLLGSNFLLVMGYTAGPLTVVLLSKFRDRKSTRLNSSHDQISYAVFCL